MKVTLVTCAAGPHGVARPGTVLDLQQTEADDLIKRQFARPYDRERDRKAVVGYQQAKATDE